MKAKLLVTILVIGICGIGFHCLVLYPYYVQPKEDTRFLMTHPNKEAVQRYFGKPKEELESGETFKMTGWHPLPNRAASHAAWSYTRRNGQKVYIFFGADGRVEEFMASNS